MKSDTTKVHKCPVGASGTPANWATWWVMDGGDDAAALRVADDKASLNAAVEALVQTRIALRADHHAAVRPILTGDGKAMLAANAQEGGPGGFF